MTRPGRHEVHDVVVVGAGMAGLSAAWDLVDRGRDVLVLEGSARVGGRVETRTLGGLPAELGATFLTNFHRHTLDLVDRSGLGSELLPLRRAAAVVDGGRRHLLDLRSPVALVTTLPPRTWSALLRLAVTTAARPAVDPADVVRAAVLDDRSAASWMAALPPELTRRLLEPALRGFLYWEPESTSRAMLMVLVRAALSLRQVLGLRAGLGSLPEALSRRVPVRLGATATSVTPSADRWRVHITAAEGPGVIETRQVVLAVPGQVAAPVLAGAVDGATLRILMATRYAGALTVNHVMPQACASDVAATFITGSPLVLATSASGRSPVAPGRDLVTFYGADGRLGPSVEMSSTLLAREARRLAPGYLPADPEETVLRSWPAAVPAFPPGRLRELARLDHDGLARRGLALAGDYLDGPSIEGAVQSGRRAARRLG